MKRKELDNILRNLLVAGNIVTVSFEQMKDIRKELNRFVKPVQIDDKVIATIAKDSFNKGRYCGSFGAFGCCNNSRYPDTVEFISGCIENHFAGFGLNVVFE